MFAMQNDMHIFCMHLTAFVTGDKHMAIITAVASTTHAEK
jgi:hypothetical protein